MRFLLLALVPAALGAQTHALGKSVDWPMFGGTPDNTHYSTLSQITPANVSRLRVAWTYETHDEFKGSEMQTNPVVIDGALYGTSPKLRVFALNAQTGRELGASNGKQYVVIACGGGKNDAPSGGTYVAFALPGR